MEQSRNWMMVLLPLWLLSGCGVDDVNRGIGAEDVQEEQFVPPTCESPGEICLAEPELGVQIRTVGASIEPGQDVEYCEVVALPGTPEDVYYVNAFESQMTEGSHHLIVAAILPGTDTDAAAQVGDRVKCVGPDVFGGEIIPVTGSQQPYGSEKFPQNVGRTYYGGQKVVFDYHYFNTTSAPLQARAAVNFHATTADQVTKFARTFGFYNLGIEIPPGASAEFNGECFFDRDVYVHKLTRHTHQWGTDFKAWARGGAKDGQLLLESSDYETVDFPFEEPLLMPEGSGFEFSCAFDNTENYTLTFGLKASDEMCILFGAWYVEGEQDVPEQSCYLF